LALAGEATDGEMAVSLVRQERPDVVVMDVMMPRLGGLETIRQIKRVVRHEGADPHPSALVPAIWDACEAERPRPAFRR
jgi:CheY-like chemotaxis protein